MLLTPVVAGPRIPRPLRLSSKAYIALSSALISGTASSAPRLTRRQRVAALAAVLALLLLAAATIITAGHSVQIIRTAVCDANTKIDCNSAGLGGITKAADALVSPVLVALFAISPIACLIGTAAVMFGNRRGLVIIGSALGALILAGAVKGIVA
jgi:hypothetical protein